MDVSQMLTRPRRLRGNPLIRGMVRETRVSKASLIYPLFVRDGENILEPIPSLDGQLRCSVDRLGDILEDVAKAGVSSVMFFGLPDHKDEVGSQAYAEDGVVQRALRWAKERYPELYYITDVCMCEYTSHGHCGVLCGQKVDNDKTLPLIAKTALSHVQAGADMVAPSDMMDGRINRYTYRAWIYRYTHSVLCGEVCVGILWPVPGSGRLCSCFRRPKRVSDGLP